MENFKGKYIKDYAPGGAVDALVEKSFSPAAFNKLVADYAALRAAFIGLLAKLDADAGVTDEDYEADLTPAAATAAAVDAKAVKDLFVDSPKKMGI